mgnify:CR=1 FL=1
MGRWHITVGERQELQEKFLTLEEVAEWLIVPPSTVRNWIVAGKLRGFKVGKHWRVRVKDVKAFLDSCEFKKK